MAGKEGPSLRIKLKAKDKSGQMTATNRDGSTYKGAQVEFLSIWDNNGMLSGRLAPDFGITYKGKPVTPDFFINVYDERSGGAKPSRSGKQADDDDF